MKAQMIWNIDLIHIIPIAMRYDVAFYRRNILVLD